MIMIIVLVVLAIFVVPVIFQFLWNITMPEVFGLKTISYWQAFRLLLLAGLIFGVGSLIKLNLIKLNLN